MKIDKNKLLLVATEENEKEKSLTMSRRDNRELHKASMRIAMKIKRALRKAGMTQNQLADKMEMDPGALSRLLNGKANLELKTMVRFEKELGITIIDRNISPTTKESNFMVVANFYNVSETLHTQDENLPSSFRKCITSEYFRHTPRQEYTIIEEVEYLMSNEPLESYS